MKKCYLAMPVALSVLALALSACGSGEEGEINQTTPENSASASATGATPQTFEAGEHVFTEPDTGGEITINFPVEDSVEVTPLKDHLTAIKAPTEEMVFMTVDIDNRQGSENSDPMEFTMTDGDGHLYVFSKTSTTLDGYSVRMEWPDDVEDPFYTDATGTVIPEDQYDALNRESTDLYNASLNGTAPGQRQTVVYVYDGSAGPLPETFTNITLETAMASAPLGEPAPSGSPSVDEGTMDYGTESPGGDIFGQDTELDTSAQSANISGLSEATAASYGLIPDEYYPTVRDSTVMCAESDPTVCSTGADLFDIWMDHFDDPDTKH